MELERSVAAHPQELAELDLFDTWRLAELPADHFDPFLFHHRMATYRLLIDTTNRHGLFGPDNRTNPLWGLMFQHQWQFRTGRLGADSQRTGRIDPDAPWGYGNYTLCVIPWMGAVEAGTVEPLALTGPLRPSRFAYPTGDFAELVLPAGFHRGVADWKAYFSLVESARPGDDVEPLRMALWKAHKTCLDLVVAHLYHIDAEPYSDTELRFLRGWCRMVDYLWVAAWPTDFDFMCEQRPRRSPGTPFGRARRLRDGIGPASGDETNAAGHHRTRREPILALPTQPHTVEAGDADTGRPRGRREPARRGVRPAAHQPPQGRRTPCPSAATLIGATAGA